MILVYKEIHDILNVNCHLHKNLMCDFFLLTTPLTYTWHQKNQLKHGRR